MLARVFLASLLTTRGMAVTKTLTMHPISLGSLRVYCKVNASFATAKELAFDSTYADGTHGFCNWLLPGYIMIGKYPGRIPLQQRPTPKESQEHLKKVLKAGVRTFVCLQDEVPPQADDNAWSSSPPLLFERYYTDATQIAQALGIDIKFVHFPIKDRNIPSDRASFQRMVAELAEDLDDSPVYIHCWGGKGRSAMVGACLMLQIMDWRGATAKQAAGFTLAAVQAGFETRKSSRGASPETPSQVHYVVEYAGQILPFTD